MTEEQARTKWCPMARMVGYVDWNYQDGQPEEADCKAGWNRRADTAGGVQEPKCRASGCMAWRMVKVVPKEEGVAFDLMEAGSRIEAIKQYRFATGCTLKEAKEWSDGVLCGAIKRPPADATVGYCGAFGKAEG